MTSNFLHSERVRAVVQGADIWSLSCPSCDKRSIHRCADKNRVHCHACGYEVKL